MTTFETAEVCHDEVTSTDGRRHARAGVSGPDARIVSLGGDRARALLSSVAGSDLRCGGPSVPGASDSGAAAGVEHLQHRRAWSAVLLSHHAEARPHHVLDSVTAAVGEVAVRAQPRGGAAAADARDHSDLSDDADDLVCLRPAAERSAAPAGAPYRFRADDDPGGTGKGRPGSGTPCSLDRCSRRCGRTGPSRGRPTGCFPPARTRHVRWIRRASRRRI